MKIKTFILSGVCIVIVGILMLVVALINLGGNLESGSLALEEKVFNSESTENYSGVNALDLSIKEASVSLLKGEEFKVEYEENSRYKYEFSLSNGTLKIKQTKKFMLAGFNFINRTPKIKITLDDDNVAFKADITNGSFTVSDFGFTSYDLGGTNGACKFESVTAGSLFVHTTNGAISLTDVNVTNGLSVSTTNGAVTAKNTVASEITLKSTNGKVNAENVNADGQTKINSTNGAINVTTLAAQGLEVGTTNGKVECNNIKVKQLKIKSTNGDISASLAEGSGEFKFITHTTHGKVRVPEDGNGNRTADLSTTNGDIKVSFI